MADQTYTDIPNPEMDEIKRRLMAQIQAMNDSELKILSHSEHSLAHYVAGAFQAIAKLFGYVIAYPIALGIRIAKSLAQGFADGWNAAFKGVDDDD